MRVVGIADFPGTLGSSIEGNREFDFKKRTFLSVFRGANLKYRSPEGGLRYFPSRNRLYIKVKQGYMMISENVDY